MRGSQERLPVEAKRCGPIQQGFQRRLVEPRLPRQYPCVFSAGFADQHPAVARIERQDPVVAIEGAEETDPQLGAMAARHDPGDSVGLLDRAVCRAAAIHHCHLFSLRTVQRLGIRCAHRLKAVWQARNLVPGAVIALQVDSLNRRKRRVRGRGACRQQSGGAKAGEVKGIFHGPMPEASAGLRGAILGL